jgi:hypothetical protein
MFGALFRNFKTFFFISLNLFKFILINFTYLFYFVLVKRNVFINLPLFFLKNKNYKAFVYSICMGSFILLLLYWMVTITIPLYFNTYLKKGLLAFLVFLKEFIKTWL